MAYTRFKGMVNNDNLDALGYNEVTAVTNAATLDKLNGKITSSVANLAAGAVNTITLTNSVVKATSEVQASVAYEGAGLPLLLSVTPKDGQIIFKVTNIDDADALVSAYKITYLVTNI